MTKFSTPKLSLVALSGIAVLVLVASTALPAAASTGSSRFRATPEELRRHCWRRPRMRESPDSRNAVACGSNGQQGGTSMIRWLSRLTWKLALSR